MMNQNGKNTNESKKARYVVVGNEHIYLNPAEQKAWDQFVNNTRNEARRKGTCGQPNYHLCFGDCELCHYKTAGKMVSTDDERYGEGFSTGSFAPAIKSANPERIVTAKDTLESVLREAAKREPSGDVILRLHFEEGLSSYKIAERLDMRQTTVNDKLNRLLRYFREHRSDFI